MHTGSEPPRHLALAAAWSYQQVVEVKVGAEAASTLHGAIRFHLLRWPALCTAPFDLIWPNGWSGSDKYIDFNHFETILK